MGSLGRPPFSVENPTQGFTPVGLPGCILWLRADSISGLANGASVENWADQSGSGYVATQATGSKQPTYRTNVLNSKPVLRFDGVDDFLSIANFACVCRISMFVVAKFTTAKPMQMEQSATANSNPGFFFYGDLSGPVKINRGAVAMSVAGTDDWMGANFALVNFSFTGTVTGSGTDLYRKNGAAGNNGTTGNTLGATDTTVTDTLYLCSRAGTSAFSDGDLAEIIIYNNPLTAAQILAVEGYLNGKYNLY